MFHFLKGAYKKVCFEIISFLKSKRFVAIYFGYDGMSIYLFKFNPSNNEIKKRKEAFFGGLNERNFTDSKLFRFFLKAYFFPFRYKILAVVNPDYCRSSYSGFSTSFDKKDVLTETDFVSAFSNNIWGFWGRNKKEALAALSMDDLDIILLSNRVEKAMCDGKNLASNEFDSIFGKNVGKIEIGVSQTMASRSFFVKFRNTIPKRASIYSIREKGFSAALYSIIFSVKKETKNNFTLLFIDWKETHCFVFDGEGLKYFHKVYFGAANFYDSLRKNFGTDKKTIDDILEEYNKKNISEKTKTYFDNSIKKDFSYFQNCLYSIKRDAKIKNFVLFGINDAMKFMMINKKFSKMIFNAEYRENNAKNLEKIILADLLFCVKNEGLSKMQSLILKIMRWLLPTT